METSADVFFRISRSLHKLDGGFISVAHIHSRGLHYVACVIQDAMYQA